MLQSRQGDVLIVSASIIPPSAQRQACCVLARGEATGHAHQIHEGALLWVDTDGTKYLEVFGAEAKVEHEEHGPIVLAGPAIYRIVLQREYTPEAIRNVAD